jgi:glycosyltransferase involved in cell wall biosynthesis
VRVLHIGKFFPPHRGGMETYLADLIAEQRAQGIEAFALVHGNPLPNDPEWLVRVPVQAHLAYAPLAAGFPLALHRAIRSFRPNVLHMHMPNNSVFWALVLPSARALPWVVHWHSDVLFPASRRLLKGAYQLYRPFEWAVLERAERIVATSPPYMAASAALAPWHHKCTVIPLGLKLPAIAHVSAEPTQSTQPTEPASAASLWTPGRFRLLSIGRLAHYKGFETLIRAVLAVPEAELCIVGDGEERNSLATLLASSPHTSGTAPRVRLLGQVPESVKQQLLQSCDLFCLASRERTEAFGVVLLEAMAHAKPCAVSALQGSGMPWIVQVTGCGVTIPVDDIAAWSRAIEQLRLDPAGRARMGSLGHKALLQRFGIDANVRCLQQLYGQLVPHSFKTLDQRVLIVIPAKDEATTIGTIVETLRAAGWRDVLVVDDHSADGTGEIARAAGARVLRPVLPVGAWGGMQTGLRYALREAYGSVITMDADGQHDVSQIPLLLTNRKSYDMIIGAFPERASKLRRLAWLWFRNLAGFDLRDLTSGFRFYNRTAMQLMTSEDATLLDYQDLGALLLARGEGLRIHEVPVAMHLRSNGASRIFRSWFGVARYMALTTVLCLSRRPRNAKP